MHLFFSSGFWMVALSGVSCCYGVILTRRLGVHLNWQCLIKRKHKYKYCYSFSCFWRECSTCIPPPFGHNTYRRSKLWSFKINKGITHLAMCGNLDNDAVGACNQLANVGINSYSGKRTRKCASASRMSRSSGRTMRSHNPRRPDHG